MWHTTEVCTYHDELDPGDAIRAAQIAEITKRELEKQAAKYGSQVRKGVSTFTMKDMSRLGYVKFGSRVLVSVEQGISETGCWVSVVWCGGGQHGRSVLVVLAVVCWYQCRLGWWGPP